MVYYGVVCGLFDFAERNFVGINFPLKVVKVCIDLVISSDVCDPTSNDSISDYLNKILYTDPEFFGDFGPENIIEIKNVD